VTIDNLPIDVVYRAVRVWLEVLRVIEMEGRLARLADKFRVALCYQLAQTLVTRIARRQMIIYLQQFVGTEGALAIRGDLSL
jgi:hypothetical protein